jgi:hypothetical protein
VNLFKYVAPERVDVLLNGRLRFTQAADFNDPFEIVPHLAAFLPVEHEDKYLQQLTPDGQVMFEEAIDRELGSLPLPPELKALGRKLILQRYGGADVTRLMKEMLPEIIERGKPTFGRSIQERLGERIGVLSLAESPRNLLMWAHYGSCHRGFAIEFDGSHSFFSQTLPPTTVGRLMKVVYSLKRPAITAYDPSVAVEVYASRLITDLLLTKSKDWEYEQEWRMVLPVDDQQRYPHEIDGRFHLFPVPREAFRGIVIGARASDATKLAIRASIEGTPELMHVTVRHAHTSDTSYEVVVNSTG